MPVYLLRCEYCGTEFDNFRSVADHGNWGDCPECESPANVRQVITAPACISVDNMPRYICPQSGEKITSRQKRNESFARHGLMDANELGPSKGPAYTPLETVDVEGEQGANLSQKPSNARKMSRREDEQLTEDIKHAIGITP